MPDTPETFRIKVTRQDIADPDEAEAELLFVALSDGDTEMTVRWGDPPRDHGSYLIPKDEAWDMVDRLDVRLRRWVKAQPE